MKCDECLSSLETGGWWRRWQARRHVSRCPSCAAEVTNWDLLKEQLGGHELLSAELRSVWMHAASCESPSNSATTRPLLPTGSQNNSSTWTSGTPEPLTKITPTNITPKPTLSHPSRQVLTWVVASVVLLGTGIILATYSLRIRDSDNVMVANNHDGNEPEKLSGNEKTDSMTSATVVIPVDIKAELNQLDVEIVGSLEELQQIRAKVERLELLRRINAMLVQDQR